MGPEVGVILDGAIIKHDQKGFSFPGTSTITSLPPGNGLAWLMVSFVTLNDLWTKFQMTSNDLK